MLENYRNEGAAINVLSNQHGLDLTVIDAGVIPRNARSGEPPSWIAPGTRNFRFEPAMSAEQCTRAIETGRTFATDAIARGSNALLLGEMGIGNTACAAMLLHRRTGWPLAIASGAAPDSTTRLWHANASCSRNPPRAARVTVAIRNAGGVRRLRARDARRRDARSRAPSLHRGRRRLSR
jgi:NaMN:DMB phosphoribosyltransferase